ncbi:TerC family protein [Planctomicrobium sp. SH527]|uniref:TerC family protein n=1 Tax=Planctomicrobium sp. SH527 TaxID=3448123 RepID=UPI003F5BA39F
MPWWIYAFFIVFVGLLIILDLTVLHRGEEKITVKKALAWTCFWVFIAMCFNGFVYLLYEGVILSEWITTDHDDGKEAALEFFAGYIIEYSLSVDNIFVIAMIIQSFRVPPQHQHRLLFWGIAGAAILRGIMIFLGAKLVHEFSWTMYFFGGLLIVSAIRMARSGEDDFDPDKSAVMRFAKKLFPVTHEYHGKNFFTIENGKRIATPMFLAVILIESCDVMFAVDSIPAVFAITTDPFIVFSSNIFAILGLRSLYFALAGLMADFHYLKMALVVLMLFVGVKMLLVNHYHIPIGISLGIIGTILATGVIASLVISPPKIKAESLDDEPPRIE